MREPTQAQELYADISACLLALCNALCDARAVSREQLAEAFQERVLAMQPNGEPSEQSPYQFLVLKQLATDVLRAPPR